MKILLCFGGFNRASLYFSLSFSLSKKSESLTLTSNSPSGGDVAQEVVAAVQQVVSHGVGVDGRGKGAEVRAAQCDLLAGADEPRRDVVDVRVDLARDGARAHKAGVV